MECRAVRAGWLQFICNRCVNNCRVPFAPASVEAYERAASQGRAGLRLLHRPINHRRWGESSWLNYWQGRNEGLWAAGAGDNGHEGPSINNTHHRRRVLGGS